MREHKIESEFAIELTVHCDGMMSGPDTSVGEVGVQINEQGITDLVYERAKYDPDTKTVKIVQTESLFAGLDIRSGDLGTFVERLNNLFASDIGEALISEASE